MASENPAKIFRDAWIAGVNAHYPGTPKASYVAPWEEMPDWERSSAAAVYEQVQAFLIASDGHAQKLNRTQKGRFVALCWVGQVLKHIPDPKPGYVADWDDLPAWQQQTDADIFEAVERDVVSPRGA